MQLRWWSRLLANRNDPGDADKFKNDSRPLVICDDHNLAAQITNKHQSIMIAMVREKEKLASKMHGESEEAFEQDANGAVLSKL